MEKNELAKHKIQRMLNESYDEKIFVRKIDSDTKDFAFDVCSESESDETKPSSENDDEHLWSEGDIPPQEYVSTHIYEGREGTIWKSLIVAHSKFSAQHNSRWCSQDSFLPRERDIRSNTQFQPIF
ncbi:hypothetical protein EVAR_54253_1 [Eumeta japonica]|uniref:Uncharacterized protein n=1 Tax=Eumeta variegata TaxID=151549 RepID=A0A4C1YEW2_EUMVA|nr:hypothetical protein EVAR_54253_1 [Eumeta japonica]